MTTNVQVKGGSDIKFWISELFDTEDTEAEKRLRELGLEDSEIKAIKAGRTYNLKGVIE